MSAPSLASEIAQLHELLKLGALTEEEFNTAKQATIRNFTSSVRGPPAAVAATAVAEANSSAQQLKAPEASNAAELSAPPSAATLATSAPVAAPSTVEAAVPMRSRVEWQQLWSRSPLRLPVEQAAASSPPIDIVDVRTQALRCADRLFRNVQSHPTEAKYRRIRGTNRVVAQELLLVEASAALLRFAGFTREEVAEATPQDATIVSTTGSIGVPSTYVWVQHDEPAEAARKAAAACRLVSHLLEYMGKQQSRRFGVQRLWRSVALEVRLERAAREAAAAGCGSGDKDGPDASSEIDDDDEEEEKTETADHATSALHPFLSYLVECYAVDEAGDGLYSSLQHLLTLQKMYEAQLTPTPTSNAAATTPIPAATARSPSSYSLLETAEVYGAVVQQRGAIELLLNGCGAQLHPFPAAVQRAGVPIPQGEGEQSTAASSSSSSLALSSPFCPGELYWIELLPLSVRSSNDDPASHVARCVRLIKRVRREVERVQRRRAQAARESAEKSMRQELKRERQRQQLEQGRVRGEVDTKSQSLPRRVRLQGAPRCASSSSSSSSSTDAHRAARQQHSRDGGGGEGAGRGRRVPIAEALAILMGKKSPPSTRPPAASSPSP
ncbi:hypothetical protein ABB37_07389 [Leptomonas pyrrhocoris]|uniref:PUB domain-containing protein n=1 Tax=Leptomonas pyrrhocoris TaxID=157538 RepID=A0A0M9FVP3_LEPPY|nr:hypothetical protein ABB37_07389 [Leptomonas pyrrhocoris]KPA77050.1 hypothetical protein ABB37_07389 [Leptomonas pyrrhocoris]|eukprot:XP_015655489.1 hypothetical protein ABB37_07389 [Leptomonas pyrrhocoris]